MNARFEKPLIFILLALPFFAGAADWPQILGPNRNGVAEGEEVAQVWQETGPEKLWQVKLGQGYAGPAVVGNQVVVYHMKGTAEQVIALDRGTGKEIWKTEFPTAYQGGMNEDSGPRCVPVIHGDSIFVFSAAGELRKVDFKTGAIAWTRRTAEDYTAPDGYFGFGTTPIVLDDKVIVNVGGKEAGVVAFDVATGKTAWKATDERASYASPTSAKLAGKTYAIVPTRMNTVALDPSTGKEAFRIPFGMRGPTVNAAAPLVFEAQLFLTASYRIGAQVYAIGDLKPKKLWSSDRVMNSQYASSVYRQGHLYGIDGREDIGVASYQCVDAETGELKWSEDGFGIAHTILVGDSLLVLKIDGALLLADANPGQFKVRSQARVSSGTCRALPALSNGVLFFRDTRGGVGTLYAVKVR